jgi:Flp pilus assembly protein TadG
MRKEQEKSAQTAQGMVEFALVLPILLLLILGIFAFGHMFFVYSSVVSASREAARWGAAVGQASEGEAPLPRYQDCASIRAAAVRVGAFAGVDATEFDPDNDTDSGVNIAFDAGPGTAEFDSCPEGGVGPAGVEVGDRIVVTVRVNYTPIVPFVNLPSFPIEATTGRTIIINLPVGEAPIAEDPCTVATDLIVYADPEPSYVGQPMTYTADVVVLPADPSNIPTGSIRLVDSDGNTWGGDDPPSYPLVNGMVTIPYTYMTAGVKEITAEYIPDSSCYMPDVITPDMDVVHEVLQAPTAMTFTFEPAGNIYEDSFVFVNVTVSSVAPGAGIPQGPITVTMAGQEPCVVELDDEGKATCPFVPTSPGSLTITGVYEEDADPDYAATTHSETVTVRVGATPTRTATPTITLTPTPVYTPTKTPLPAYCPRASSGVDFSVPSALQFNIANNGANANASTIREVIITWPGSPQARLQQLRFGADVTSCVSSGNPKNCLFNYSTGLLPTSQTVNADTIKNAWDKNAAGIAVNDTQTLRLVYNAALPPGEFTVTVKFDDPNNRGCQIDVIGTR